MFFFREKQKSSFGVVQKKSGRLISMSCVLNKKLSDSCGEMQSAPSQLNNKQLCALKPHLGAKGESLHENGRRRLHLSFHAALALQFVLCDAAHT